MSDSETDERTNSQQSVKKSAFAKKKRKSKIKTKIILNISDCQYPVVSKVGRSLGWKLQSSPERFDWDVCWTDNAVQPQTLIKMHPHQKINHFPGMFNLARKNLMGRSLMKMRKKFGEDYSFFPMTWMLPADSHELKSYVEYELKGKTQTFIVKPQALSQGKGIYLTKRIEQIEQSAHCVVQRYLQKPYLIEGLKFDLRIYVLVASVDPLRLYIFDQGLVRFATEKYEPPTRENMEDICMHLTNYSINKDSPKFIFNDNSSDMSKGHKRSLSWLYDYLSRNEARSKQLQQKIESLIVKTMIAGLPIIASTYRSCQPENHSSNMCFQVLGFDVILTDSCEPVLLEINHTPSFSTDTPLDQTIKTRCIRDALRLMNVNQKIKTKIIQEQREACQQRMITGKKIKLTSQQRQEQKRKAQIERDIYENENLGGFKKIYPIQDLAIMGLYEKLLNFSIDSYQTSTGTKRNFTVNRQTGKVQSAFGTCFTKKIKSHKNQTNFSYKLRMSMPEAKDMTDVSLLRGQQKKHGMLAPPEKAFNDSFFHSEQFIDPSHEDRDKTKCDKSQKFPTFKDGSQNLQYPSKITCDKGRTFFAKPKQKSDCFSQNEIEAGEKSNSAKRKDKVTKIGKIQIQFGESYAPCSSPPSSIHIQNNRLKFLCKMRSQPHKVKSPISETNRLALFMREQQVQSTKRPKIRLSNILEMEEKYRSEKIPIVLNNFLANASSRRTVSWVKNLRRVLNFKL